MVKVYDLEERTTDFAKRVIRLCKQVPMNPLNSRLINQLVGSAGSIGANYREANDALGKKDFVQRMKISRREAKEIQHWLECLSEVCPNQAGEILLLLNEVSQLRSILSSIIGKLSNKQKTFDI